MFHRVIVRITTGPLRQFTTARDRRVMLTRWAGYQNKGATDAVEVSRAVEAVGEMDFLTSDGLRAYWQLLCYYSPNSNDGENQ